jgi:hypothetical protein
MNGEEKRAFMWDFDGACKPGGVSFGHNQTFSVGIFQWIPTADGKRLKRGKVNWRIRGLTSEAEQIYERARAECARRNSQMETNRDGAVS